MKVENLADYKVFHLIGAHNVVEKLQKGFVKVF